MASAHATGLACLDDALGGLPSGSLVQLHGPPSAGKTTLAMVLARSNLPAALVLPEAPHPDRLRALLDGASGRVLVHRPEDLEAQDRAVEQACRLLAAGRVGCAVLDSLTYFYRFENMADTGALRVVLRQLHRLRQAARAGGGLAVFTNQVRGSPRGPVPIGGPAVGHATDVSLGLSVLDGAWRRVRLEKHPLMASEGAWDVRITGNGLEPVG